MTAPTSAYTSVNSPSAHYVLSGEDGASDRPPVTCNHTVEPRSAIDQEEDQSAQDAVEGWFNRAPLANSLEGLLERYPRAEIAQCIQVIIDRLEQSLGPTH